MTQISAGQAPGIPASGQFRIASVNLHYGGGDDSRWQASLAALRAWDPDIVLLQGMAAPAGIIAGLHAHLRRTANELGVIPLPGTTGHIDADLNDPGTLLEASRYPTRRRAVTSCSVIWQAAT